MPYSCLPHIKAVLSLSGNAYAGSSPNFIGTWASTEAPDILSSKLKGPKIVHCTGWYLLLSISNTSTILLWITSRRQESTAVRGLACAYRNAAFQSVSMRAMRTFQRVGHLNKSVCCKFADCNVALATNESIFNRGLRIDMQNTLNRCSTWQVRAT